MLLWGGFRYPLEFTPSAASIFPDDRAVCDVDLLDLVTWAWSRPAQIGCAAALAPRLPRGGHAATLVGDTLLIFGGVCLPTAEQSAQGLHEVRTVARTPD